MCRDAGEFLSDQVQTILTRITLNEIYCTAVFLNLFALVELHEKIPQARGIPTK